MGHSNDHYKVGLGAGVVAASYYANKKLTQNHAKTYRAYEDAWLNSLRHKHVNEKAHYALGAFDQKNNLQLDNGLHFPHENKLQYALQENRRQFSNLQTSITNETPNLLNSIERSGKKFHQKNWADIKIQLFEKGGFNTKSTVADWTKTITSIHTQAEMGTKEALENTLHDMDRLVCSSAHITQEKTFANELFTLISQTYDTLIPIAKKMQVLKAEHDLISTRLNLVSQIENSAKGLTDAQTLMSTIGKKLTATRIGKMAVGVVGTLGALYSLYHIARR